MPEICRFFGIVIRMYFLDHAPPHFHASYSGSEAQVQIQPIGLLSGRLTPRALALVVEWATLPSGGAPRELATAPLRRAAGQDFAFGVVMEPRIVGVRLSGPFQVSLDFTDGSTGSVDLTSWIGGRGGVFAPLQDQGFFARVSIDADAGTIVWPNGVDLDPDMLYEAAHASPTRVSA